MPAEVPAVSADPCPWCRTRTGRKSRPRCVHCRGTGLIPDEPDDVLQAAAAKRAEEAIARLMGLPEAAVGETGPYNYAAACTASAATTTVGAPTVDHLLAMVRQLRKVQEENDDGMAAAIAVTAWRNRIPLDALAARLGVWYADLVGILSGALRPIPRHVWDALRLFCAAHR